MSNQEILKIIFSRTDGCCHICGKKLCFSNYGKLEGRGKWEIEHSIPKSNRGSDHLNNLYAACITCNRSKGNKSTRIARASKGRTRAPYSTKKKEQIKNDNAISGGLISLGITMLFTTNPVLLAIGTIG